MPKTPTSPSQDDAKPYARPRQDPSSPTSGKGPSKPWTGVEKLALLEIVLKKGSSVKSFEGALEGRTANQCDCAWRQRILPSLKRYCEKGMDKV